MRNVYYTLQVARHSMDIEGEKVGAPHLSRDLAEQTAQEEANRRRVPIRITKHSLHGQMGSWTVKPSEGET